MKCHRIYGKNISQAMNLEWKTRGKTFWKEDIKLSLFTEILLHTCRTQENEQEYYYKNSVS